MENLESTYHWESFEFSFRLLQGIQSILEQGDLFASQEKYGGNFISLGIIDIQSKGFIENGIKSRARDFLSLGLSVSTF